MAHKSGSNKSLDNREDLLRAYYQVYDGNAEKRNKVLAELKVLGISKELADEYVADTLYNLYEACYSR